LACAHPHNNPFPILGAPMPWVYLMIAGVLEIVWAFAMKQSDGFTRLVPSIITIGTMVASFWLLALAMRTIPLGTAYMIWTGIGAVGAFAVGIWWLAEPVNALRLLAAFLIVAGLALIKVASAYGVHNRAFANLRVRHPVVTQLTR